MQDRKTYGVMVRVFADKARTKLLGTHQQAVVYQDLGDPEAVLRRLNTNRPRPSQR